MWPKVLCLTMWRYDPYTTWVCLAITFLKEATLTYFGPRRTIPPIYINWLCWIVLGLKVWIIWPGHEKLNRQMDRLTTVRVTHTMIRPVERRAYKNHCDLTWWIIWRPKNCYKSVIVSSFYWLWYEVPVLPLSAIRTGFKASIGQRVFQFDSQPMSF